MGRRMPASASSARNAGQVLMMMSTFSPPEQRGAHRAAHVALTGHDELADRDAGVLGGEVGFELVPHLGVGAALPLQDDEFAAQVLRPGGHRAHHGS